MSRAPPIVAGVLTLTDKTGGALKSIGRKITGTMADIAKTAAGFLVRDLSRAMVTVGQEAILLGSRAETLQTSFDRLKGTGVDQSLEQLREAVNGTVSDIDLLTAANQAMALGLPTEQLDELFAAAQKVGAAMGRTTLQAVQDLTTGMGRQSKLILDNLGIIVNTEKAYDDFAEKLGITTEELSDQQRKTAFVNAAMAQLNKTAKDLGDNVSETQMMSEQFTTSIKNLKTEIGTFLIPIVNDLIRQFTQDFIPSIQDIVEIFRSRDFSAIGQLIRDTFTKAMDRVTVFLKGIDWNAIWLTAVDVASNVFTDLRTRVVELVNSIDWQAAWQSMLDHAGTLWGQVKEKLIDWGGQFKKDVLPQSKEEWREIWGTLFDFADTLWDEYFIPALKEIAPVIKAWLPATTQEWADAWTTLWDFGGELWDRLLASAADIATAFKTFIEETNWEPVKQALANTIGKTIRDAIVFAVKEGFISGIASLLRLSSAGYQKMAQDMGLNPFGAQATEGSGGRHMILPARFPEDVQRRRTLDQMRSTVGGGASFIFNIRNFIGLDENSARQLAKATARYHVEEFERRAVPLR